MTYWWFKIINRLIITILNNMPKSVSHLSRLFVKLITDINHFPHFFFTVGRCSFLTLSKNGWLMAYSTFILFSASKVNSLNKRSSSYWLYSYLYNSLFTIESSASNLSFWHLWVTACDSQASTPVESLLLYRKLLPIRWNNIRNIDFLSLLTCVSFLCDWRYCTFSAQIEGEWFPPAKYQTHMFGYCDEEWIL
jgi:hypothetical protein